MSVAFDDHGKRSWDGDDDEALATVDGSGPRAYG
jgi:hypothetical protein